MKKKIIFVLLCIVLLFVPDRYVFAQDTDLQAPSVQYKLNNHDSISLKWNNVEGADAYYIYRTDVKTGKTFRYPSVVNKTENTIGGLSPDNEYIFSVAPIKKNGDRITVGKRSSGTKLTTPKKWYLGIEKSGKKTYYFKENYANTIKEKINLANISADIDGFYNDGWFYVIGDYTAIVDPERYENEPLVVSGNGSWRQCVARIKEDGTKKEILFDDNSFLDGGYINSYYIISDNDIYICSYHREIYEIDTENKNKWKKRYYSDPKYCWVKKISLTTGRVETLLSSSLINWFYCNNGYIYFEYDDSMTLITDEYGNQFFVSEWYDYRTNKLLKPKKPNLYYYKMNNNGKSKQLLSKHQENDIEINKTVCINDNQIAFIYDNSIYTTSIKNDNKKKIYECKSTISKKIQIINGYIYFSERIDDNKTDAYRYCRIKTDGTGLEKQDKPFEWFY